MFFSFDGVDGAGKSTQIERFGNWLTRLGHEVIVCRDPGTTPLGESLRTILLQNEGPPIHRRSEMLLYMASRSQLVEEIIRPSLDKGKTVVSDRFLLANVVYQGHAGGLDVDDVCRVGEIAVQGVTPDLTFVLDIDPRRALQRMSRPADRMESHGVEYLEKVRQGFLAEAGKRQGAIIVIDADRDIDVVQQNVQQAATRILET